MRVHAVTSALIPTARPASGTGRHVSDRIAAADENRPPPQEPNRRRRSTTPEQLAGSLTRFADLSRQSSHFGAASHKSLPVAGQRAVEAYLGTRREEEKQFLHEVMGIDTYA
ncbi:MAG: hypothetical protein Kow006_28760 [Gammaproteobacteria bacterium]